MSHHPSPRPDQPRRPPPKPPRPWWMTAGIVLATILGILGLVFLGLVIFAFVALGMSGSNK